MLDGHKQGKMKEAENFDKRNGGLVTSKINERIEAMLKITRLGEENSLHKYVDVILLEFDGEYGDTVSYEITEGDMGRLNIKKVRGFISVEPCSNREVELK